MYREVKIIHGILHVRYSADDGFKSMDLEEITEAYQEQKKEKELMYIENQRILKICEPERLLEANKKIELEQEAGK